MNSAEYAQELAAIDPNGCDEVPGMEAATQTVFNYANGSAGYLVLVVGLAVLLIAVFGKKWLAQAPGWLGGALLVGLTIAALPALLSAFGINVGCAGGGSDVVDPGDDPADNAQAEFELIDTDHPGVVVVSL